MTSPGIGNERPQQVVVVGPDGHPVGAMPMGQDDDGDGGADEIAFRSWAPTWFDHQNMRDDRAEAFSTWLPSGVYDYTYVARATTPGSFVVPPTRAEEMYAPETFGRSQTDTVVVDA